MARSERGVLGQRGAARGGARGGGIASRLRTSEATARPTTDDGARVGASSHGCASLARKEQEVGRGAEGGGLKLASRRPAARRRQERRRH